MAFIVVSDGHDQVRELIREVLDGVGHDVFTAASVNDILTLHRETPVDLVLAGVRHAPFDEKKLVRQFRTNGYHNPIILLTGALLGSFCYVDVEIDSTRSRLCLLGKPFAIDVLLALVQTELERKTRNEELGTMNDER
jgi:DNA-binding response OmpR family regulator